MPLFLTANMGLVHCAETGPRRIAGGGMTPMGLAGAAVTAINAAGLAAGAGQLVGWIC